MNQLMTSNQSATMTSSQLAKMLGKQKKHINESIRGMFSEKIDGQIIRPSLDSRGYVSEYHLPELESKMFVAKYDIEYLEMITRYWINKGNENKPALPSTKELALMVIKAEEEKEAAMLEVDRLQGVCNTITAQFSKGTTAPVFFRQLNGVNVQQVNNKLIGMGMLLKTARGIEPTSYARDKYFKVSYRDKENKKTGWNGQVAETTLTLAGAKWLYRAYLSNKLPMKNNWDGNLVHVEFESL